MLATGATPVIPALAPADAWFFSGCWTSALWGAAADVLADDPPDPNYDKIVLPRAPPRLPGSPRGLCRNPRGKACKRLVTAASRYSGWQRSAASVTEALAITTNRFATAQAAGDSQGQVLQSAVAKVYFGVVVYAQARESATGRRLAGRLGNFNLVVTSDALRGLAPRLVAAIPPSLISRLGALGLDTAQTQQVIRESIDAAVAQGGSLDLQSVLRQSVDVTGFAQEYRSITVAHLAQLVSVLTKQGIVSGRRSAVLNEHLSNAQRAPSAKKRARAIRRFRKHAKFRGRYSPFLQVAAAPLSR